MFLLIGFSAIGWCSSLSTPLIRSLRHDDHSVFVIVDGVEPANESLFSRRIKRLKEKDVVSKNESFKTKNGS